MKLTSILDVSPKLKLTSISDVSPKSKFRKRGQGEERPRYIKIEVLQGTPNQIRTHVMTLAYLSSLSSSQTGRTQAWAASVVPAD